MNNDGHSSQISAWFDGELTDAERAIVERRLEESVDDRDELAEYRQMTEWLSELPVESLPTDFAKEITATAADVSLPPETDGTPHLLSSSSNVPHQLKWSQGFGIVLTTAAMLFVAFTLFEKRHASENSNHFQPFAANSKSTESELLAQADDRRRPSVLDPTSDARVVASKEASKSLDRIASVRATPRATGDDAPFDSTGPGDGIVSRDALAEGLRFRGNLKSAEIGDIVEAMDASADRVSVVRLTVVDRRQGLEQLQVLLSRNHIPRKSPDRAPLPTGPQDDSDTSTEGRRQQNDQLVAVYVEATGDQLTSVLEQIRREQQFQNVDVDRAIAYTTLAQATPHSLGGGFATRKVRSPAFSAAAAPAPAAEAGNKPTPPNAPGPAADKKGDDGEKRKDGLELKKQLELERISRQLQVELKPEMLANKPALQGRAKRKPAAGPGENQVVRRSRVAKESNEEANSKPNNRRRAAGTPLQVLFVLDVVPAKAKSQPDDGSA